MNAMPLLSSLLAALADAGLETVLIGNAAAAGNGDAVNSAKPKTQSGSRLGMDPQMVVFPQAGGLILIRGGFESHVHVQSFSTDLHTFRWALQGGGATDAAGAAIDDKGRLCLLRIARSMAPPHRSSG